MIHKIKYNGDQKIWFSSDFHFFHRNIVRGVSDWTRGTRDFESIDEHNETLINNINNCVGKNDILYFLGDFTFGSFKPTDKQFVGNNMKLMRDKINCENIHFIVGNHDEMIYDDMDIPNFGKATNLFSSVHRILDLEIKIPKQNVKTRKLNIILSHYPMRSWDKMYRNSFHLFGHCHNTLDNGKPEFAEASWIGNDYFVKNMKTMDVGVDCHPEFRPFELSEIIERMDKIETNFNFEKNN